MRLAYLLSRYPAANHTYLLREIRELEARGAEVERIAIRGADRPVEGLSEEERREAEQTFVVTRARILDVVAAHVWACFADPRRYWLGVRYALGWGLALRNPRRCIFTLLYFVEAIVVGREMHRRHLAHLHCHFTSSVGLLVAKTFPVTVSLTIHGPAEFFEPRQFRLSDKVATSSFVSVPGEYALRRLCSIARPCDRQRVRLNRHGVDLSLYAPVERERSVGPFKIICPARLDPIKGQRTLLAALQRLIGDGHQVELHLVGDGPDREILERLSADLGLAAHVRFDGWLDQSGVRALYRESDVLALASYDEGIPAVLMEAMAMSIPCVATPVGGVPELIRDGVDGLLVAPGDVAGLARALATVLDDAALRARLGQSARARAVGLHSLAESADRLMSYFAETLLEPASCAPSSG